MSEYIVDYELIPLKWRDGFGLSDVDLTEEIVRCRDCAKADYAEVHMFDGTRPMKWTCTRFKGFHHIVQPDGFCAWATRKEDDE